MTVVEGLLEKRANDRSQRLGRSTLSPYEAERSTADKAHSAWNGVLLRDRVAHKSETAGDTQRQQTVPCPEKVGLQEY